MLLLLLFSMSSTAICDKNLGNVYEFSKEPSTSNLYLHSEVERFKHFKVVVRDDISGGVLKQFWKSTGLCPPDPHENSSTFLLSNDMKQNLFHIGSVPYEGIKHVRIHWLLDLIQIRVLPNFKVIYNFTFLDQLVHEMWKNNLYLGFEIMGNPSNIFTDFENDTQIYLWRDLVKCVAKRYINLFGIKYVMKWNFETWNEPDHHDFDKLNFTIQGFLNYYDACSEGLKLADKHLKFGGPGGSCHLPITGRSPMCWALLNHCIKGKNYFTGKIGNRIDFISFHKKGNASSSLILEEELKTINYIRHNFNLKNITFYNDEADPLKNWAHPEQWRTDSTYAAMVVKILFGHINFYFLKNETKDINFGLLSNDNAFLSYYPNQFSERTLLARFQVNNTVPKYVEFVRKPVYSVLGLLSQLCSYVLHTDIYETDQKENGLLQDFGFISTECISKNLIVLMMYNSADSILTNVSFNINVVLNISLPYDTKWFAIEVNNAKSNPYFIWEHFGKPAYPSLEQLSVMREVENPAMNGPWNLTNKELKVTLLNPGVTLITICKMKQKQVKVASIKFLLVRNNSLLISWKDKNRCITTYNVEYSVHFDGPFVLLNKERFVYPSYWNTCSENDVSCSVRGYYRIYSIDYWNNRGPYSKVVKFIK